MSANPPYSFWVAVAGTSTQVSVPSVPQLVRHLQCSRSCKTAKSQGWLPRDLRPPTHLTTKSQSRKGSFNEDEITSDDSKCRVKQGMLADFGSSILSGCSPSSFSFFLLRNPLEMLEAKKGTSLTTMYVRISSLYFMDAMIRCDTSTHTHASYTFYGIGRGVFVDYLLSTCRSSRL